MALWVFLSLCTCRVSLATCTVSQRAAERWDSEWWNKTNSCILLSRRLENERTYFSTDFRRMHGNFDTFRTLKFEQLDTVNWPQPVSTQMFLHLTTLVDLYRPLTCLCPYRPVQVSQSRRCANVPRGSWRYREIPRRSSPDLAGPTKNAWSLPPPLDGENPSNNFKNTETRKLTSQNEKQWVAACKHTTIWPNMIAKSRKIIRARRTLFLIICTKLRQTTTSNQLPVGWLHETCTFQWQPKVLATISRFKGICPRMTCLYKVNKNIPYRSLNVQSSLPWPYWTIVLCVYVETVRMLRCPTMPITPKIHEQKRKIKKDVQMRIYEYSYVPGEPHPMDFIQKYVVYKGGMPTSGGLETVICRSGP